MAISKHEAAHLFQRHRLEGLPARVIGGSAELAELFRGDFAGVASVTIRACGIGEDKNLPRLVAATHLEAITWLAANVAYSNFVVQPYDELVFSLELVITPGQVFAEIVPGIWELDNSFAPATLRLREGQSGIEASLPMEPQPAKFWDAHRGAVKLDLHRVEDWHIEATARWIMAHTAALSSLAEETQYPLGIKAHFSRGYGVSPQNIHTDHVVAPPIDAAAGAPAGTPVLLDVGADVPSAEVVILMAGIGREEHTALVGFIDRLRASGVRLVYLQSGLLSHLAITLREGGFEVRRA